jgi:hypothetical protein
MGLMLGRRNSLAEWHMLAIGGPLRQHGVYAVGIYIWASRAPDGEG